MTIPFADFFNKAKARLLPAVAHSAPAPEPSTPMEKASSERFSKTVLPHTIRKLAHSDPSHAATAGMAKQPTLAPAVRPVDVGSQRTAARSRQSPRTSALGLEPTTERTISLELADVLEQMPAGYIKPPETLDLSRPVQFSAAEIEKGMGEGKPRVSLTSLYEQAPEIFLHRLSPAESACVPLSFEKVLKQFNSLRLRPDQVRDDLVPHLDTAFLKVTLEDMERFGTTMEPVLTSALPPVRVELASAEAIAAATPEPIASQTITRRSLPLLHPAVSFHEPTPNKQEAPPKKAPPSAAPQKISLHLPPNGTGVPASEKVPASSGPPVPTSLPDPPTAASASSVPFTKVTAPSEDLRAKFQRSSAAEPARAVAAPRSPPKRDENKVALVLHRILEEVPAFQLNGSPSSVPENVRVELPVSLIQPQLASGRVVVSPKVLQRAMPEIYRDLLNIDPGETPISLPLQEILKHLPPNVLRLRDDQEETVLTEKYETMFSIKADEDAKRLRAGVEPAGRPPEKHAEQPQIQEKIERKREGQSEATSVATRGSAISGVKETVVPGPSGPAISIKAGEGAQRSPAGAEAASEVSAKPVRLQVQTKIELEREELSAASSSHEEKLDAKSVVARARALPGVAACLIALADDGLSLGGGLPAELAADGVCAMAPSLLQKIANHMRDSKLGPLTAMTLHCEKSPLTFFRHGNICLTALHAGGELTPETRAALGTMAWALSRTYSKPEPSHVDH
jgi:hypothetical protein